MSYPSLAVIGTAGRKEDKPLLTVDHYNRMVQATMRLIRHLNIDTNELKLYSGGAAWADHIVVTLALLGVVDAKNVTLYLPTELDDEKFVSHDAGSAQAVKTASTANYYHQQFSNCVVFNSIQQIIALRDLGAALEPGTGNFFQRNAMIAKAVSSDGILLAYTFGNPASSQPDWTLRPFPGETKAADAGLKDGGTAHTWDTAKPAGKWHGRIGRDSGRDNR
jgi:hypothetical protein